MARLRGLVLCSLGAMHAYSVSCLASLVSAPPWMFVGMPLQTPAISSMLWPRSTKQGLSFWQEIVSSPSSPPL
ncbi:hypothetical protein BD311DRAFT_756516 [Dichomitus squalens]|uniref:Secreted protein n=1 Tax=Dichomitus squalens TaxID=114155 RepID=A0A4Q9MNV9_9APHY|nr:hypothetical protein BD311DRAFT_756516 [Dichomitus squalens]